MEVLIYALLFCVAGLASADYTQEQISALVSRLDTQERESGWLRAELADTRQQLGDELFELRWRSDQQQQQLLQLEEQGREWAETAEQQEKPQTLPAGTYNYGTYTVVGCRSQNITIKCHSGGWLDLTVAYYGKNNYTCTHECCGPHPTADCKESVEDNQQSDWIALQALCQNRTECVYYFVGSPVNSCELDYLADYMEIKFDCIGEQLGPPIGYSAYSSQGLSYLEGQVVVYDNIISNFGGFFNPVSSIFTCPLSGVYLFTVSAFTGETTSIQGRIMIDTTRVADVFVDKGVNSSLSSSGFVIASCMAGEQAWVQMWGDNYVTARDSLNMFSGYMLYSF